LNQKPHSQKSKVEYIITEEMTMRIDWLIDWDGDVNPSIQEEVDFWAAWKGLNKMRQEHYQEGFGEYFWGQPRSAWTPWQHRAAAEDLIYPWSDWEERYPYTLCERVWYADWLYQRNLSHTGGKFGGDRRWRLLDMIFTTLIQVLS
jgi:hypothetical protein